MATTRYRDTRTGKLVKKSTWKRAKSRGSSRYKRESIKKKRVIIGGEPHPIKPPTEPGIPFPIPDDFFDEGYEAEQEDEY